MVKQPDCEDQICLARPFPSGSSGQVALLETRCGITRASMGEVACIDIKAKVFDPIEVWKQQARPTAGIYHMVPGPNVEVVAHESLQARFRTQSPRQRRVRMR